MKFPPDGKLKFVHFRADIAFGQASSVSDTCVTMWMTAFKPSVDSVVKQNCFDEDDGDDGNDDDGNDDGDHDNVVKDDSQIITCIYPRMIFRDFKYV